jgi:diguanylate cyclase (GGDEF)-like protein
LVVARMRLALAEIAKANQQKDTLQDELAYEAAHDYLTRLPNRSQAVRQIEAALFRAQRAGSMIGLLFIDLDHFKIVNDTFGHRAGDEVLREVATRMAAQVRGGDMVARLGGDEFVVLLEPIDAESSVVELGERIIRAVSAPIATGGRHVLIGASVGVAVSLDGGTNADHLLGEADAAAYRAKSNGRGRVEVFDGALRRELSDRAVLETAILTGLREDEFELHYQPVVDLEREQVLGFEALIRWNRPGFGLVYPDEFIPTAEHSQLICDLGRWVLAQATRQLSQAENRSLTVAVNISGRHLASAHVLDDVRAALTHSGLDPRRLTLELTETMIIDDPTATDHLRALRDLGVSISIDDFGTGYTSISQLRHLPVDSVKIDRSFMAAGAPNAGELVSLMVNAAHAFGLFVIAEGVEQPAQLTRLREIGCDGAQGYLLGRPLPAQAIPALAETAALR